MSQSAHSRIKNVPLFCSCYPCLLQLPFHHPTPYSNFPEEYLGVHSCTGYPSSYALGTGSSFPAVTQPEGKANDFLLSSAITNMWSYTSPPVYRTWCLIMYRDITCTVRKLQTQLKLQLTEHFYKPVCWCSPILRFLQHIAYTSVVKKGNDKSNTCDTVQPTWTSKSQFHTGRHSQVALEHRDSHVQCQIFTLLWCYKAGIGS
jgi:hypothetical protein